TSNAVQILEGNGLGGFSTPMSFGASPGPGVVDVAVGFFNGDASPDVAAATNDANTVAILLNTTLASREACCLPNGTCQDLTSSQCQAAGGAPQGPGTTCATTTCPAPGETNCSDGIDNDGDTFVDCMDADCAGDPACAPPGACCLPGGTCQDLLASDCTAAGGVS